MNDLNGTRGRRKESAVVFTVDPETLLPSPGPQRRGEAACVQVGGRAGLKRQRMCHGVAHLLLLGPSFEWVILREFKQLLGIVVPPLPSVPARDH